MGPNGRSGRAPEEKDSVANPGDKMYTANSVLTAQEVCIRKCKHGSEVAILPEVPLVYTAIAGTPAGFP